MSDTPTIDTDTTRIRSLIAKHEARYAAAFEAMEVNRYGQFVKPTMTYAKAMDEMGKAGRRLYNLRRQLARAEMAGV